MDEMIRDLTRTIQEQTSASDSSQEAWMARPLHAGLPGPSTRAIDRRFPEVSSHLTDLVTSTARLTIHWPCCGCSCHCCSGGHEKTSRDHTQECINRIYSRDRKFRDQGSVAWRRPTTP